MATEPRIVISAIDKTKAAFDSAKKGLAGVGDGATSLKAAFVGLAAALALPAAYAAFDRLVKQAGDFQDMSEKVGDTAEAIASLNLAAGTAGTSMDVVTGASIKLTKNLTGVDDESKAAGAAIAALGLGLEDFKNLKPADQMEAVAKALAGFEDGASKTAVAMALFGKSGAELLPFLKELGAEGGRQIILTAEQIKQADEYSDKQARLRTQINLYAQAIATQFIEPTNAAMKVVAEMAAELVKAGKSATDLGANNGAQVFAENAIEALAFVADAAKGVETVFSRTGEFLGATGAALVAKVSGDTAGLKAIQDAYNESLDKGFNSIRARYLEQLAQSKTLRALALSESPAPGAGRPKLKFDGAAKAGKDTAAQDAKAQLASDIEAIKKAGETLVSAYANAEKIMEALRAAGLVSDSEYYQSKRDFILLTARTKDDELSAEIGRFKKEQLTGKDKIENDKKIAEAESKLAIDRAKTTADLEVLSIQQADANSRIARSYEEARMAAMQFIATQEMQYERELANIALGERARARNAGRSQIDDKYQGQRDELENQKRLLEMEGKFTSEARQQYETRLAIINEFQQKALEGWDAYYARLMEAEGNWSNGASRALQNYMDQASKTADQTDQLFTKAFQGMEDALVSFVTTGKLDFKSLADSIVADITRIIIKQQISKALGLVGDSGDGGGGGFFDAVGGFVKGLLSFDVGTDFVPQDMVAKIHKGERIIPAAQNKPGYGGVTISNSFMISGATDRRTQLQIAAAAAQGAQRGLARNT